MAGHSCTHSVNLSEYRKGKRNHTKWCGWIFIEIQDSRELAESIRLVYRGGTMINHDLFHRMWEENEEIGLFESNQMEKSMD